MCLKIQVSGKLVQYFWRHPLHVFGEERYADLALSGVFRGMLGTSRTFHKPRASLLVTSYIYVKMFYDNINNVFFKDNFPDKISK